MSAEVLTTMLWPMAVLGILPTCLRVTLNFLQDLGTSMLLTLNCMASLLSTTASQPAAMAGALRAPAAHRARVIRIFFIGYSFSSKRNGNRCGLVALQVPPFILSETCPAGSVQLMLAWVVLLHLR
jgi:hypothetical protein